MKAGGRSILNSPPFVRQYDILKNWKGQEKTDRKLRAIKEIEIQIELGLTSQAQNGCV